MRSVFRGFVLVAGFIVAPMSHAFTTYTVGADGACTHSTIQAAMNAAEIVADPNGTVINIASNQSYDQQAISSTYDSGLMRIVGGFANCSQDQSDGSHAIIDGAGGEAAPVFHFESNAHFRLFNLTIQHGDAEGSGKGGGIYYKGYGGLELHNCSVTQNIAGYGAGIYVESSLGVASFVIGEDVAIVGNTARFDGGGIVNEGAEMTMIEPDSYIADNHAPNGYGGGLLMLSHESYLAYASLGSTGFGDLGLIYLNDAKRGGGVAFYGTSDFAGLFLYTTDLARPVRINGNYASVEGGGIYLGPSPGTRPTLRAWNVWIENNLAPHGAAIFMRQDAAGIAFNAPAWPPPVGTDCPVGTPCGGIIGNVAEDESGQPSGGILESDDSAYMSLSRTRIDGNTGRSVVQADHTMTFVAHHVAITGNTVSGSVIATDNDDDFFDLENITIAGNSIGDSTVLRFGNDDSGGGGSLLRSIIWQPGKITLHLDGDPLNLLGDMVSERDSVDGGNTPYVVEQNPRFVDPGHGDYSLRAGSPAVDRTTSVAGDDKDLNSNPRDVDLPIAFNLGVRDVGAIERQTLQPLVLNSDFDADLRLWSAATPGVTTWDASTNMSGAAGSGSAHIMQPGAVTGTRVGGVVQCVHLPGPGTYALNGWGHGTGTAVTAGDIAELYWEYRKNGEESCTEGAPDETGTKTLSNSNSWSRPATPAYIEVTEQDWTYKSSIAVTLVAEENGPSGAPTNAWFDGITLGIAGDDRIFDGDFENIIGKQSERSLLIK